MSMLQIVALAHAGFFAGGGGWAILSPRTFQRVTGPKVDYWLVHAVALLLIAVAIGLVVAALRDEMHVSIITTAIGTAAALLIVDVVHVGRRRISKVYLIDGACQAVLIVLWMIGWLSR